MNKSVARALDNTIMRLIHTQNFFNTRKDNTIALFNDSFTVDTSLMIQIPEKICIFNEKNDVIYEKNVNINFALAEAAYILEGREDAGLADDFKFMQPFLEDNIMVGSYGPYFEAQLIDVIDRLINDKFTRQAVISVWPIFEKSKRSMYCIDVPCTNYFAFYSHDGITLNMTVMHRSSDVMVGLTYDIVFQQILLHIVSAFVNMEHGSITNMAINRHIYIDTSGIKSISTESLLCDKYYQASTRIKAFNFKEYIIKKMYNIDTYKDPFINDTKFRNLVHNKIKVLNFDIIKDKIKIILRELYKDVISGEINKYLI